MFEVGLFLDYFFLMATRDHDPAKTSAKTGKAARSDAKGDPSALPVSDSGPGRGRNTVSELPDAAPDATGLTPRQQRILNVLRESIEKRGYPPSIREIGELVGLTSSSSVAHQLRVLEQKGFIKRDPNRPRALEVFIPELMAARRAIATADDAGYDPTGLGDAVPDADDGADGRPDRRRWPDPGRGAGRGDLPAAQDPGRRRHPVPARGLR